MNANPAAPADVGFAPWSGCREGYAARAANSQHQTLALAKETEHWSLTTLREKLIKIGAKIVSHGRYVTFQMAEVAVPKNLFQDILRLIERLRTA